MRCKKHLNDFSSSVGVCASCLCERLSALIEAQTLAEAHAQKVNRAQEDRRKSDACRPPLAYPRSVSPYISHRKSDNSFPNHHHTLSDQLFYGTPQIGRSRGTTVEAKSYSDKKQNSKFSLLSRLFRSKLSSPTSCMAPSSSRSWFSNMLSPAHPKKETSPLSLDQLTAGRQTGRRYRDRGMSPATVSDCGDEEECNDGSKFYSPEQWKQTPQRAAPPVRRGGGQPSHSRNVSGLKFCLSPLVRASPNRLRNQKGMPPDILCHGDVRVPAVPNVSRAAAFAKNRSRKIADFGRFNHNH